MRGATKLEAGCAPEHMMADRLVSERGAILRECRPLPDTR